MQHSRPTPYFSRAKKAADGSVIYFDSQEEADRFDAGHGVADSRTDSEGRVFRADSNTPAPADKLDARERMIKRNQEAALRPATDTDERTDDGLDARERFLKRIANAANAAK